MGVGGLPRDAGVFRIVGDIRWTAAEWIVAVRQQLPEKFSKLPRRYYSRRIIFLPGNSGSLYLRFVGQNLTRFFKINPSLILGTETINNEIFNRSLRTTATG